MYHPSPLDTPVDSATSSVRKDAPNPMNNRTKMLGIAAGIATRKIKNHRLAPSVRATSRYDARTFDTPDAASIVTGNQTASAIRKMPAVTDCGKKISAIGIHAVAGIGPTIFRNGMPQYRACRLHPIVIPLTSPAATPTAYPEKSSLSEAHVLLSRSYRSSISVCS